jgi:hypothetical protein
MTPLLIKTQVHSKETGSGFMFTDEDMLNIILTLGLSPTKKKLVNDRLTFIYSEFGEAGIEQVREKIEEIKSTKETQNQGITDRDYALKKADVLEWDTSGVSPLMQTDNLVSRLKQELNEFLDLAPRTYPGYTLVKRLP